MNVNKGKIKGVRGSFGSGLAYLEVEDVETGDIQSIPSDNGPLVRALEASFGDVIGPGHTINPKGSYLDQMIYWSWDDMGLTLGGFTPEGEADPIIAEVYKLEREDPDFDLDEYMEKRREEEEG
jgi:hypothetical protein